jgi:hypothetical protein
MIPKDETTHIRVTLKAKDILERYAALHNLSMPMFLDRLATTLLCGIDGLMEWELDELKEHYRYSDLAVYADIRELFLPIKETEK